MRNRPEPDQHTLNTDVPWLDGTPWHWPIMRAKFVLREVNLRSETGSENLLRVSQYSGVTLRGRGHGPEGVDTRASSLVGYKKVTRGDLVVNIMLAWNGSLGVSDFDGIVSPAYCVYRFENAHEPRYFHYLLRSVGAKARIKTASTGIVESRLRLYSNGLGNIELPVPPIDEQRGITTFLGHFDHLVSSAIAAKKKTIALLNEQKQAIIHKVITQGLDATAPVKPSRVDWVSAIPSHWQEFPLRRLAVCENSGSYGTESATDLVEMPVATTAQIDRDGNFHVTRMPRRFFTPTELARYTCREGDVLVVKSSGSAANVISGKCGIVRSDTPTFVFSNFLARFTARAPLILPEYLYLLLTSYLVRERVKRMVATTTYPNLRMNEYRGSLLPVPPIEEQNQILDRLRKSIESTDRATELLHREVTLLNEYRARIIFDVVTGKLDVREAAAILPDPEDRAALEVDSWNDEWLSQDDEAEAS